MRGISWVAKDLLASQEGLFSMELVIRCFDVIGCLMGQENSSRESCWMNWWKNKMNINILKMAAIATVVLMSVKAKQPREANVVEGMTASASA
jgi:hypothetical protein